MTSAVQTKTTQAAPPLWQQLDLAATGVCAVKDGQSARSVVLAWPQHLRSGAQALLYTCLRSLGTTDALVDTLVARKPAPHVRAVLCTALAVLIDDEKPAYTDFTVVNQAVEALRKRKKYAAQAGFVNACLRRFLREKSELLLKVQEEKVAQWNHPQWWIQMLEQAYPKKWQSILQANNARAPLTLRINESRIERSAYLAALKEQGVAAVAKGATAVELTQATDVRALPGYDLGWFAVQDAAAQLAAPLLLQGLSRGGGQAPLVVLDACAAPGGKTLHLLEEADRNDLPLHVIAMDVDAQRCERIHENLQRMQYQTAQVVVADSSQPEQWRESVLAEQLLDLILLDAPCSASGIVRRHPDIRWLRRKADIANLAQLQQRLLHQLWPLLRPGGRLLYCTCSVFEQEGGAQIEQFLQTQVDAQLAAPVLQLLPERLHADDPVDEYADLGHHDGFFYALLHKLPNV